MLGQPYPPTATASGPEMTAWGYLKPDAEPLPQSLSSSRDIWLWLVLLLALALRTYHLNYPPWDFHNWRQTQTLMVARDYARHGFRLLRPQVAWVSHGQPSRPSYYGGEFSIQSILAAVVYRLFGESDAAARWVVIAFSLLGTYFLYALMRRRADRLAAGVGAFIYSLLPYHLFFGRVFMPDIPALSLALGGLERLDRWTDDRQWKTLLVSAVFTALAVLQKVTVIFVGMPALYLFWLAQGRRLFSRLESYVFAGIVGLPTLAWYVHSAHLSRESGFEIIHPSYFGWHLGRWLQLSFIRGVLGRLAGEALSPLGLALAVVGLFWPSQARGPWTFRVWVLGAALLLSLIPELLPDNYYYLSLLLPGVGALAGFALASLAKERGSTPLLALVLALFALDAIRFALPLYGPDRSPVDLGHLLKNLTAPEDLVVTASRGSPDVLYAADRRGWIGAQYDLSSMERLARAGARYYATPFINDQVDRREFYRAMNARFERLTPEDSTWPVYYLGPASGPLRQVPQGEVPGAKPVNFGDRIELLAVRLREILDWPSSYEVTYYWRCLDKMNVNLRVFVHITTPEGKTVYEQEHWPLAGHLPTSQWNIGDVVRERYVMVLPNSLAAGRYQIRVGWVDPNRGPRLRVVNCSPSDGEGRAIVAEINAPLGPRYEWFRAK